MITRRIPAMLTANVPYSEAGEAYQDFQTGNGVVHLDYEHLIDGLNAPPGTLGTLLEKEGETVSFDFEVTPTTLDTMGFEAQVFPAGPAASEPGGAWMMLGMLLVVGCWVLGVRGR